MGSGEEVVGSVGSGEEVVGALVLESLWVWGEYLLCVWCVGVGVWVCGYVRLPLNTSAV